MSLHIKRLHSMMNEIKFVVPQEAFVRRYSVLRTKILALFDRVVKNAHASQWAFESDIPRGQLIAKKRELLFQNISTVVKIFNFLQNSADPKLMSRWGEFQKEAFKGIKSIADGSRMVNTTGSHQELQHYLDAAKFAVENSSMLNWLRGFISRRHEKFTVELCQLYLESRTVTALTSRVFQHSIREHFKSKVPPKVWARMEKIGQTYDRMVKEFLDQSNIVHEVFQPKRIEGWVLIGHPAAGLVTPQQRKALKRLDALKIEHFFHPRGKLMSQINSLKVVMRGKLVERYKEFDSFFIAFCTTSLAFQWLLQQKILDNRKASGMVEAGKWLKLLTPYQWELASISPLDLFFQQLMMEVNKKDKSFRLNKSNSAALDLFLRIVVQILQIYQGQLWLYRRKGKPSQQEIHGVLVNDVHLFTQFSQLDELDPIKSLPISNKALLKGFMRFFQNQFGGMNIKMDRSISFLCIGLGNRQHINSPVERQFFKDQLSLFLSNIDDLFLAFHRFDKALAKVDIDHHQRSFFDYIYQLIEQFDRGLVGLQISAKQLSERWKDNSKHIQKDLADLEMNLVSIKVSIDISLIHKVVLFANPKNESEKELYESLGHVVNLYNSQILLARPFVKLAEVFSVKKPKKVKKKVQIYHKGAPKKELVELDNENEKEEIKPLTNTTTHIASSYRIYSEKLSKISRLIPAEIKMESPWTRLAKMQMFKNGARAHRYHTFCLDELSRVKQSSLVFRRASEIIPSLLLEVTQKIRLAHTPPKEGIEELLYTHDGKLLFTSVPEELKMAVSHLHHINAVRYHFLSECTGYSLNEIDAIRQFCSLDISSSKGRGNRELKQFEIMTMDIVKRLPRFKNCSLEIKGGKLSHNNMAIKRMLNLYDELKNIEDCPALYVALHTEVQTELLTAVMQDLLLVRGKDVQNNHNFRALYRMLEIKDDAIASNIRFFDRGRRYLQHTAGTEHMILMGELLHAKKLKDNGDFYTHKEKIHVESSDLEQRISDVQTSCAKKTEASLELAARLYEYD